MIEIPITEEMYATAERYAKELGALRGSIMRGGSNIYGFLGEEIFQHLFPDAVRDNEASHDFTWNGLRIDVKSKRCATKPKLNYEASVVKSKNPQDTDIYFFCRIHTDTRLGWAMGWMPSKAYLRNAYVKKKGDKDPSNGNICKRTCWNMYYHDMLTVPSMQQISVIQHSKAA